MKPIQTKLMKRIEIIVPSIEQRAVLSQLDKAGVSGYSILHNVVGKGNRGVTLEEEELDQMGNDYILTICDVETEPKVLAVVQPFLKRYGGVCISSDVQWLIHDHG